MSHHIKILQILSHWRDIIDLTARDTSRHHITSKTVVRLNDSHSNSNSHNNSTVTVQSRAALLSVVRYYHRVDDTSRLVVAIVMSVELLQNTHHHYYYYYFHFYNCYYHRVVTIAEQCSHSVWFSCVLFKVRCQGDAAYISRSFNVGTSV